MKEIVIYESSFDETRFDKKEECELYESYCSKLDDILKQFKGWNERVNWENYKGPTNDPAKLGEAWFFVIETLKSFVQDFVRPGAASFLAKMADPKYWVPNNFPKQYFEESKGNFHDWDREGFDYILRVIDFFVRTDLESGDLYLSGHYKKLAKNDNRKE